jgi:putative transposase
MKQITISESYTENKYMKEDHSVGISMWHYEWCPKYRFKIFRKWKYKKLMEGCIRNRASAHKIKIMELDVQPDHVHLTCSIPFSMSPSKAMQLIKGGSSKIFFERCPNMRKRYRKGFLWSRGKLITSLGFIQVEVANAYVRQQDKHHETEYILG